MYRPHTTLEQWRILQAVVDHGGYAHAAQALNKSQSSLNHAVAKLQQLLGVQLLEVKGRKAELTAQGRVMLRRSRVLTQEIEQLELLANNLEQGWEPEIRLSREILFPTAPLYHAMQQFYPESRGTRLTVLDNVLSGTTEAITERSFDLVISGRIPPGYRGEHLGNAQLLLVCHPQHPLSQEGEIDEKRLAQELQLVIRDTGSDADKDLGWLKAEQRWTFSNFHEAIEILLQGVGFCWVPQHIAQPLLDQGRLHHLVQAQMHTTVIPTYLVIPSPDCLGPAAQRFAQLLVECSKPECLANRSEDKKITPMNANSV
ncbi:LysR family transcriptional regulator [Ferrimonas marina]|uniref:DNA-binding transcriptional regulator, LysR family n=1 Tax=Ferrimonas marina TaxID=299255 RepID=A0A1M5MZC3_9GAMM|nr:LysR family transcriptional regulator [Ferrimonas marina]SHG82696.1 DNA-binding transcriptional regulator, LysR family [Ferrimonas marina]